MEDLLESLSLLTVEEKLSQWRKIGKGKNVPSEIKQQVVGLLSEHKFGHLTRKLGLSGKTLKCWQREYSSEQVFITLPPTSVTERNTKDLSLKFSRSNSGTWSLEGALSLKDWQSAIRLLEGVR